MNGLIGTFGNDALLDRPIWNSLVTDHAALAIGAQVGRGLARRYPAEIGPLAGFKEPTLEAYEDLAALLPEGDVAVLFLEEQTGPPEEWELVRSETLVQMVCREVGPQRTVAETIVPMGPDDFAEMEALARLAQPGPFRAQTARLGGFLGIRQNGRLVAMAGQRLAPAGFHEVSAVCTHPDFRGRGYAQALVGAVARNIQARGRVPFLTSLATNAGAIRVYEQAGFAIRRRFELAVLKAPARG